MSVRSSAMRPRSLPRRPRPGGPGPLLSPRGEGDRAVDDRRLAVRAHLPGRLERPAARGAGGAQLRRAHGAHEEVRLDLAAADAARHVGCTEATLDRPDL